MGSGCDDAGEGAGESVEAVIAGMLHEMLVDEKVGEWLSVCEGDGEVMSDEVKAVNIREVRRSYGMAKRLPSDLVRELTSVTSMARGAWAEAKEKKDYSLFSADLERVVTLLRKKAMCLAEGSKGDGELWDALADEYEPGCKAKEVEQVFTDLKKRLVPLVEKICEAKHQVNDRVNEVMVDQDNQMRFVRMVADRIGFDFEAGRLDLSSHPFCSGMGYGDTRMTTKLRDDMVGDALSSTMHEAGHGMYEQGLLEEHFGLPMGMYVSLGIHECQSRLWENQVGRSEGFWKWCTQHLKEYCGKGMKKVDERTAYESMNVVRRSLIRTEADEATYNLHIMIRFELELALIRGDLNVADLPCAWNEKYRDYLGVQVSDDGVGCLQDIHWSLGAIGYFPTYTLGNMYSAQFFEAAKRELGDLETMFAKGEFGVLLNWLREKIHRHGKRYRAGELCEVVTGEKLGADALMRHLEGKFSDVYQL